MSLLTPREAAEILGVRVATVSLWAPAVAAAVACVARAVSSAVHRACAVASRRTAAVPAMPLPRPGDAPPPSALVPSPLEVAAGLERRKRDLYEDYPCVSSYRASAPVSAGTARAWSPSVLQQAARKRRRCAGMTDGMLAGLIPTVTGTAGSSRLSDIGQRMARSTP